MMKGRPETKIDMLRGRLTHLDCALEEYNGNTTVRDRYLRLTGEK